MHHRSLVQRTANEEDFFAHISWSMVSKTGVLKSEENVTKALIEY